MSRSPTSRPILRAPAAWLVCATLGLPLLLTSRTGQALEPSPRKQCAICHVSWTASLDESADLLPAWLGPSPPSRDTSGGASADAVCYSCHDGYVVDSRAEGFTGHGHPVGVRPLQAMPQDESLPLTSTGALYCGTCHTPHSESTSERVDFSFFLRFRNDRSDLCRRCHTRQITAGQSHPLDKPVQGGLPPVFRRLGARTGKGDGAILCETCHRTHGAPQPKLLRISVDSAELCAACHPGKAAAPTEPDASRVLAHRLGIRTSLGSVPAEVRDAGGRLDARGGLTCLTCHSAHRAASPQHLLLEDNTGSAFCLRCHPASRRILGSPHDFARTAPRLANQYGETAGEGGGACGVCHRAHGWAIPLGKERYSVAVCVGCHGPTGQAKTKLGEAYSHSVDRPLEDAARTAKLPVYDDWVHAAPTGRMSCGSCHDSHGQRLVGQKGAPLIPELLRQPEEQLCVACHPEHHDVVGSPHDLRTSALTLANARGKTPAESGVCGACHFVHAGRRPYGFSWAQPDRAPGDLPDEARPADAGCREGDGGCVDRCSAWCLDCHARSPQSPGQPVGGPHDHPWGASVRLTQPVSFVPPAGQPGAPPDPEVLSCCTCHETHARREPVKLLRRKVAGDSGLCLECHAEAASVAGSPHDLGVTAASFPNVQQTTVGQGGLCSACHVSHGGRGDLLWAAPEAVAVVPAGPEEVDPLAVPATDPAAKVCLGCHRIGGPGKVPARPAHPDWPLMTTAALPLPAAGAAGPENRSPSPHRGREVPFLAGGDGGAAADQGHITCRTCHWGHPPAAESSRGGDPGAPPVRPPRRSSPLNPLVTTAEVVGPLCSSCHGPEALSLFLRFHDPQVTPRELGALDAGRTASGARSLPGPPPSPSP
ncbi:MAG: cytochrome c3 family protein [Myxococcota bacterium]|nr:cytochrome c3 family protein [Myxococcota bacterium]